MRAASGAARVFDRVRTRFYPKVQLTFRRLTTRVLGTFATSKRGGIVASRVTLQCSPLRSESSGGAMPTFRRLLYAFLLIVFALASARGALADNRAFLSTSLESSQASYVLDFTPLTGGVVDKLRLAFPPGLLGGGVELR